MKLFEDTRLLHGRDTGTRVGHSNDEVPVYRLRRDTHLSDIRELDRVADQVEQHLCEPLFIAKPDRQRLGHLGLKGELLVLREGFGSRTHCLDYALDRILGHV